MAEQGLAARLRELQALHREASQNAAITEAARDEFLRRAEIVGQAADALDGSRAALEWLVNLHHGVGKAGGTPESGEWEAAIEHAKDQLAGAVPAREETPAPQDSPATRAAAAVNGRALPMSIDLFERDCLRVVTSIPLDDPLGDFDTRKMAENAVLLCREFTDYRQKAQQAEQAHAALLARLSELVNHWKRNVEQMPDDGHERYIAHAIWDCSLLRDWPSTLAILPSLEGCPMTDTPTPRQPLTPEELDRLRQLANAATPGPWEVFSAETIDVSTIGTQQRICHVCDETDEDEEQGRADAAYIAALSPDVLLHLLDERAALVQVIRNLRGALEMCADPEDGWPDVEIANIYEASRQIVADAPEESR